MAQDKADRKADEALHDPANRVALFLDFENIRHSMEHNFSPVPTAQVLCEKLCELGERFGRLIMANAYADWQVCGADPREFRRRQIEPKLVLTKENGDDRTDITMSLDALETLFEEPGVDVYVIASGDSDFHDLVQRLRRRGKKIVVCGARPDTGRELIRGADRFVALEELLGARAARAAAPMAWEGYDWTPFVRLIRDLSKKLNFVGLRYVATKVLNPHNCGLHDRGQKQELLNRAIDLKIIDAYQVDNIEEGGDPVSACRLNLESPIVKEALARLEAEEKAAPPAAPPVAPPAAASAPATVAAPPSVAATVTTGTAQALPPPPRPRHESTDSDGIGRPGENSV